MTVDEAKELIEEIDRMIEDDLSEAAWDKGGAFFEDIRESMANVEATIIVNDHVTDNQESALQNWKAGIEKWIH